ncbi:MAG: phosphoenolpyruvate synthase [Elusimicrobia bacterium]|jgi:pyruvate,water dikinase|nr:phosphoenolpyruvate synthase [Elusimicrobiota bacterium]
MSWVVDFRDVSLNDIPRVGGKNASLGEMIRELSREGIRVPPGFATTAEAYGKFLDQNRLRDPIRRILLAHKTKNKSLATTGASLRKLILQGVLPSDVEFEIRSAYQRLCRDAGQPRLGVAVRSSATAEDLPNASFAGQHESYLNVKGEAALVDAVRRCYASLFTDRAIRYREENGYDHQRVALSVGVQQMVRADKAGAGVLFSLHTDTGFPRVVVITAAWGLGENVVQGRVTPDEHVVFKPFLGTPDVCPILTSRLGVKDIKMVYVAGGATKNVPTSRSERLRFVLSEKELLTLAQWAVTVEKHYGKPMDMEWAKDGARGALYLVQARPETFQSRKKEGTLRAYRLKKRVPPLVEGLAVGDAIAVGPAQIIKRTADIKKFKPGHLLVTGNTDPDWVPVMKKAVGIITDRGGRTSHAAIVSREMGIPAIVGTGRATKAILNGQVVTLSCAEGDRGRVYPGRLDFEEVDIPLEKLPTPPVPLMLNIASPAAAFQWWRLPVQGIGLARLEFIINDVIRVHPMALVHPQRVKNPAVRREIARLTRGYKHPTDYFVERLASGVAQIAASQHPHPVIVRFSDFKTNEYANLLGGKEFEPQEENPMIGWRGASRYYHPDYREGFALECRAIKEVREKKGFTNVVVMVPFCRTVEEADQVLAQLASNGLTRGAHGLEVYVMCEIPSNVILAEAFADRFDGFSIGSNDLTQLTLGVDRDSGTLAPLFNERNPAVTRLIEDIIRRAHAKGRKVGICGQAPSDHPEFAAFLVRSGIDTISLNPDSVIGVIKSLAGSVSTGAETAPGRPPDGL